MTQQGMRVSRTGRIVFFAAIILLGLAIGYAVKRDRDVPLSPATAPQMTGSAEDPIAALEKRSRDNPQDSAAWAGLGAAYFDAGRFNDAAAAYEKATQLSPATASLWSALGEARVLASERDPMPAAAAANFERAIALDARDPRARYFLAVKKDLAGDHAGAIEDWLALLADTPADAPGEKDLRRTIEQVGKINKIDVAPRLAAVVQPTPQSAVATRAIPGPTAQDLQAAAKLPPSEQRGMAEGMVGRLEARLQAEPGNVDGWVMLMRSRMTLGQPDKAAQALQQALAANPGKSDTLRQQAAMLGIR
jgi:cytochrome c-type biogenesis protein CcmH